jgi:putative sigma-54 modulation protein
MIVNVSFTGMESSEALNSYVQEKMTKHEELFKDITSLDVVLKERVASKGVDMDFTMSVNVVLPKAVVRVDESGADMYAVIDKGSDILFRRLRRYYDRRENWDGVTPWKVIEAENTLDSDISIEEVDNYTNYAPKISRRIKLDNLSPMSEGEAIEKMELLGDSQILFKNAVTGNFTMIYKSYDGAYVMVEPSGDLEL